MTWRSGKKMTRALKDDERVHAAATVAAWLLEHAVEVAAAYRTGTNFVPVAIDDEMRILFSIAEEPGASNRLLAEIPMPAAA